MFNQKLKNRIKELEMKVADTEAMLKNQLKENQWLKWQLDNPPKYKIGEKIGELIVIGREFNKPELKKIFMDATVVTLILIQIARNINTTDKLKEYAAKTFNNQWEYELVNTTTGAKIKKKEFELQLL